jgi:hypothetical protein
MLAFTITFIKDIVNVHVASELNLLFIGWMSILTSIGLMLSTHMISAYSGKRVWKLVDDYLTKNQKIRPEEVLTDGEYKKVKSLIMEEINPSATRLKQFRRSAIITFLFGVLAIGLFCGLNLHRENSSGLKEKESQKATAKGRIVIENVTVEMQDNPIKTK